MTQTKTQLKRDIAALAAFEPRKLALRMLAEGRAEDYLDWAMEDGYWQARGKRRGEGSKRFLPAPANPVGLPQRCRALSEPTPLDEMLFYIRSQTVGPKDIGPMMRQAMDSVEFFMASALEIALDSSPLDAFERTLSVLSSVKVRASGALPLGCASWSSLGARMMCCPESDSFLPSKLPEYGLLAKAVLRGKIDFAQAMIRHGFYPQEAYKWRELLRRLLEVSFDLSREREQELLGATDSDVARLLAWIDEKAKQMEEIDEAASSMFNQDGPAPYAIVERGSEAIKALFAKGAPATHQSIWAAMATGRADLLKAALDAGGDPNCVDKGGDLLLSWMDLSRVDETMFKLWLARGGRIVVSIYAKNPFTWDDKKSAAINIARQGRLDLLKQASENSIAPFGFTFVHDGATYAPLLAEALDNGHAELAKWLVAEKGCSLSHCDDQSGKPCSKLASGDLLAAVMAEENRLSMAQIPGGKDGAGARSI